MRKSAPGGGGRESLYKGKQFIEMLGLLSIRVIKAGWDRQGGAFIGGVLADPEAGDVGRAGCFVVQLFAFAIVILECAAACVLGCRCLIDAMFVEWPADGFRSGVNCPF